MRSNAASVHTTMQLRATSTTMQLHAASIGTARHHEQRLKAATKGERDSGTRVGGGSVHMKATAVGGAARWWSRLQVEARRRQWWATAAAMTVSAVATGLGMAVAVRRRAPGGGGGRRHGRRRLGRSALLRSDPFVWTPLLRLDPGLILFLLPHKTAWSNLPPADGRKARRVPILGADLA